MSTATPPQTSAFSSDPAFTARRVPLMDGRSGLCTLLSVEVREPIGQSEDRTVPHPDHQPIGQSDNRAISPSDNSPPQPILDFISSTATVDRYGEIIEPSGWRLENYRRNPVVLNSHNHGDILYVLGRALVTEVRRAPSTTSDPLSTCLFQRVEFAVGINPLARIAYGLYRGRFLNAVSVGFVPLRWENGAPGAAFRRKYLEQELLEVSAVSIPANPNALQLGLQAGAVDRSDLRELAALLRSLHSAPHNFRGRDTSKDSDLLRLARAIGEMLKCG